MLKYVKYNLYSARVRTSGGITFYDGRRLPSFQFEKFLPYLSAYAYKPILLQSWFTLLIRFSNIPYIFSFTKRREEKKQKAIKRLAFWLVSAFLRHKWSEEVEKQANDIKEAPSGVTFNGLEVSTSYITLVRKARIKLTSFARDHPDLATEIVYCCKSSKINPVLIVIQSTKKTTSSAWKTFCFPWTRFSERWVILLRLWLAWAREPLVPTLAPRFP